MSKKITTEDFLEQVQTGKLLNDRQRLYQHIKKHPGITLNDLSRGTRIVLQTASARVSDLMDMGVVEIVAKTKVIGMVKETTDGMYKVQEDPDAILANRRARSDKKFKRAVSQVISFDEHLPAELKLELQKLLKLKANGGR